MKSLTTAALAGAIAALLSVGTAEAGPIPPGWTCVGNCGTEAADGVVTLSPFGSPTYMWTSTALGINGVGQNGGAGGTNGSILTSPLFSADAGDVLSFYFNYVTSDGAGFADYAWAMLLDNTFATSAALFTARTTPSGDTVPGFGLPPVASGVTLSPSSTPIIPGAPVWSPLGGSSGDCWDINGCGYTGWIQMNYTIPTAGNYYLRIGVSNYGDTGFDSGIAMDGAQIDGQVIGEVPAPAALALLGLGFVGFGVLRRRRKAA